jgi:hypothetical protein
MTAGTAAAAPSEAERLRALAGELLDHDAWSREHLVDHQRERLRALLRHATAHSPYYRETLGPAAAEPDADLGALPTLTKETLVEHFDAIVTDPRPAQGSAGGAPRRAARGRAVPRPLQPVQHVWHDRPARPDRVRPR